LTESNARKIYKKTPIALVNFVVSQPTNEAKNLKVVSVIVAKLVMAKAAQSWFHVLYAVHSSKKG
jgi:hypothetical protein